MKRGIVLSDEPKSTQHIYHSTCQGGFSNTYMTAEGKAIKTAYQWEPKAQWRLPPLKDELSVSGRFFFGTKRKADLDNFNKLWQDALSGIVYDDDSQIGELHLYRDYDKSKPRIEVLVQRGANILDPISPGPRMQ
jgi:Holliday junction resolvase RusA-like endonuclease